MDADQFAQFLNQFTRSQNELVQQVTEQLRNLPIPNPEASNFQVAPNQTPAPVSFTSLAPFENFDSRKEKYSCYIERFENFLAMKGITDDKKKAQTLCASIGSLHYNNLTAFLGPDKSKTVKDLAYSDLVDNFKKTLVPRKSVVIAQHYFFGLYQKEKQSVADFVAMLQRDITECEFQVEYKCSCDLTINVPVADLFLRAQFIRGLRDAWLREKLLESSLTKFEELLSKAISWEASHLESKQFTQSQSQKSEDSSSVSDINKINRFRDSKKDNNKREKRYPSRQRSQTRSKNNQGQQNSSQQSTPARKFIDYKRLGIDGLCLKCGRNNHRAPECRIAREAMKCNSCKKIGHVAKVCITTLLQNVHPTQSNSDGSNQANYITPLYDFAYSDHSAIMYGANLVELNESVQHIDDRYMITVSINGAPLEMEVDSGAKYALIGEDSYEKLGINAPIDYPQMAFRAYNGEIVPVHGRASVSVEYNAVKIDTSLYIVPAGRVPLLGRSWIRPLGIELKDIDSAQPARPESINIASVSDNQIPTVQEILTQYSDIFEQKIGQVPDLKLNLTLREGAKPVSLKARPVPFALREKVNEELDKLEAEGVITPTAASDWGSPLVPIPKPDNQIRLCIDYKPTVNPQLVDSNHPIPRIDETMHRIRNSRVFCKLDLYRAYLHLMVDPESAKVQTIITHRGTYLMNRLYFGIKTAPSEFNRFMQKILQGLPGVEFYFDDILIHAETISECHRNLINCLEVLRKHNLHLNLSKCRFFTERVPYLGFIIDKGQISKRPDKIQAIQALKRPQNIEAVRRFLGMTTQYAKFIPNLAHITMPLRNLLQKKTSFFWSAQCEAAFIKIKAELGSDRVLVPFDPAAPIVLTTDASPFGISAILSHRINEEDRPVAFASRALTPAEQNYSQLDREALAIVYGVQHFHTYVYGAKFTLETDNAALTHIFHPQKALPSMTSARLLRYAALLAGFNYSVKFKKGKDNVSADCLSRDPVPLCHISDVYGAEVNHLLEETVFHISSEAVTSESIARETAKDPELSKLLEQLKTDRNNSEYSIQNGIIFRNERVVVPTSLQNEILAELHSTHIGIVKTKQLARRYVYWKNIDRDIEKVINTCSECASTRANPKKAPIHPWYEPEENWERIHIDHAGLFQDHFFLIIVDAKSKWAEIEIEKSAPTSKSTIQLLQKVFTMHGYPKLMVSDNASIFKSDEFTSFCKTYGITQKFIAPSHPASNGLAERNVQTLKLRLTAMTDEPVPLSEKVRRILLQYRATPLACGRSPAEFYLNRKFRIRLDAIFPQIVNQPSFNIYESKARHLKMGSRVTAKIFANNKSIWQLGKIIKVLGPRNYLVQLDDTSRVIKRHIDQLRSTLIQPRQPKQVSFGPTQSFDVPNFRQQPHPPQHSSIAVPVENQLVPAELPPVVSGGPPNQEAPPPRPAARPQRNCGPPRRLADFVR